MKNWHKLVGAFAGGLAVGAVVQFINRKIGQDKDDEYDEEVCEAMERRCEDSKSGFVCEGKDNGDGCLGRAECHVDGHNCSGRAFCKDGHLTCTGNITCMEDKE